MIDPVKLEGALGASWDNSQTCSPGFAAVMAFTALVRSLVLRKTSCSARPSPNLDGQTFDFIVVGAGAAGAVVANRLSGSHSVLLLEAGGEEPEVVQEPGIRGALIGSALDWNFTTEADPASCGGKGCSYPRGKGLGGSTLINFFYNVRGNPRDFDAWRDAGNEGWGWRDVLPFFKRYEDNRDLLVSFDHDAHGTGGPQSVQRLPTTDLNTRLTIDGFEEMGLPLNVIGGSGDEENRRGVFLAQLMARDGKRVTTNRAYLEPVRRSRRNLRVVTRARVTKIILNQNHTATGVQFVDEKERTTGRVFSVFARKEVILSAGAIGTPQILQLSGVGPRAVLDSVGIEQVLELPVGLNLHDHVTANLFDLVLTNTSNVPDDVAPWVDAQREYNAKQNGPLAGVGSSSGFAFYNTSFASAEWPDVMVVLSPSVDSPPCTSSLDDAQRCANQTRSRSCQMESLAFYNSILYLPYLMRPASRGNVTLRSSDPFAAPRINPNFLSAQEDVDALVEAFRILFGVAQTDVLHSNGYLVNTAPQEGCTEHTWGSDEYIRCCLKEYTMVYYHPCGTAKMGPDSDPQAVVDSRLRVKGIANLRVVDASIMPTITTGNIASPVIMIGEKGAQMIMDDWQ